MVSKKQRRKNQVLLRAACNGNNELAEELVSIGANVNYRAGRVGGSPLHLAAIYADSYKIIRTLVAMGANINAHGNKGNTPLEVALKYSSGAGNAITALLELGAKLPHNWESALAENSYIDSFYKESMWQELASLSL